MLKNGCRERINAFRGTDSIRALLDDSLIKSVVVDAFAMYDKPGSLYTREAKTAPIFTSANSVFVKTIIISKIFKED